MHIKWDKAIYINHQNVVEANLKARAIVIIGPQKGHKQLKTQTFWNNFISLPANGALVTPTSGPPVRNASRGGPYCRSIPAMRVSPDLFISTCVTVRSNCTEYTWLKKGHFIVYGVYFITLYWFCHWKRHSMVNGALINTLHWILLTSRPMCNVYSYWCLIRQNPHMIYIYGKQVLRKK